MATGKFFLHLQNAMLIKKQDETETEIGIGKEDLLLKITEETTGKIEVLTALQEVATMIVEETIDSVATLGTTEALLLHERIEKKAFQLANAALHLKALSQFQRGSDLELLGMSSHQALIKSLHFKLK